MLTAGLAAMAISGAPLVVSLMVVSPASFEMYPTVPKVVSLLLFGVGFVLLAGAIRRFSAGRSQELGTRVKRQLLSVGATVLGAGTVALFGFGVTMNWWLPVDPEESFTVTVETDRDTYGRPDPIRIIRTVCSQSSLWRTTSAGAFVWRVLDAKGDVVADNLHQVFTLSLQPSFWHPRQCFSVEATWDQHYQNRPSDRRDDDRLGLVRGDAVPPGSYRAESRWITAPWSEQPQPLPLIITESFTLQG